MNWAQYTQQKKGDHHEGISTKRFRALALAACGGEPAETQEPAENDATVEEVVEETADDMAGGDYERTLAGVIEALPEEAQARVPYRHPVSKR